MITTIFVVFFLLILIAVPIGATMDIAALLPSLMNPAFSADPVYIVRSTMNGLDSFPYLAIPLFILSGTIMARGEISRRLFDFVSFFVGKMRGGMPCAVVLTCLFFGAISGSAIATVAAVGAMTIPILTDLHYDRVFSTALVTVAGGLGVIIPPSIPMVVYATSTGVSVGTLFIAGVIPGILIAVCLMAYVRIYCRRHGEDRDLISGKVDALRSQGFFSLLKKSFWALLAPVIILGSIYGGFVTPTEAAVISVIYALAVSLFVYKNGDETGRLRFIWLTLKESVESCSSSLFILAAATAFARVLSILQIPQEISFWISTNVGSKILVLIIINIFLLFLGMIMDTTPAIVIVAPILAPVVTALGVDPIHFGVIVVVNLAIGFVTPPVGTNLFVASAITGIDVLAIAKKAVPFLLFFLIALMFITFVPAISTCLI